MSVGCTFVRRLQTYCQQQSRNPNWNSLEEDFFRGKTLFRDNFALVSNVASFSRPFLCCPTNLPQQQRTTPNRNSLEEEFFKDKCCFQIIVSQIVMGSHFLDHSDFVLSNKVTPSKVLSFHNCISTSCNWCVHHDHSRFQTCNKFVYHYLLYLFVKVHHQHCGFSHIQSHNHPERSHV